MEYLNDELLQSVKHEQEALCMNDAQYFKEAHSAGEAPSTFSIYPDMCKTLGRNSYTPKCLALDCTCSSFEFNAYCSGTVSLGIYVCAPEGLSDCIYMSVFADGMLMFPRVKYSFAGSGRRELVLAENLTEGEHYFKIIRQSEAETGEFCIESVKLTGYILPPPPYSERYIEFIGDSITTGTGNLYRPEYAEDINTADINPTAKCYQDGTRTYAAEAASRLGADFSVIAQQGIGIICGWQPHTTLQTYEMTCYQRGRTNKWNFVRKPDIVVINLGANDFDKLEEYGFTYDDEKQGAIRLIKTVRSHYPDCYVVWAYGMIGQQLCDVFSEAIRELGGENNKCFFVKMESDSSGGGGHPYIDGHMRNAERLYAVLCDIYNKFD